MKPCRQCGTQFTPQRPMQAVCSPRCAAKEVQAKAKELKKAQSESTRQRKEAAKSRGTLAKEAQTAFNAFIRKRDEGRPCICCNRPMEPHRPGGSIDSGHYLSIGSAPHLRFDEANVHAQRKSCNRPGGAKRALFRQWMIERIGLAEVERLESDQSLKKYTPDDLRAVRDEYRKKANVVVAGKPHDEA